jgi:hypothetical protein
MHFGAAGKGNREAVASLSKSLRKISRASSDPPHRHRFDRSISEPEISPPLIGSRSGYTFGSEHTPQRAGG